MNLLFVNIGFNLAKDTVEPKVKETVGDYIINTHAKTIFLKKIQEKELIEVVNNLKNKKSSDCNDMAMTLLKRLWQNQ